MADTKEREAVDGVVVGRSDVALSRAEPSQATPWVAPEWTQERIDLAKKMVCPAGTTDVEWEYFMAWSKRTALDPFLKQSYLVERGGYDQNKVWVNKREPMAAESGLAARCDGMADYRGMEAGAVFEGDVFKIVKMPGGAQEVHHEWDLSIRMAKGNKLLGAWAHARREGRVIKPTFLTLAQRQPKKKDGTITSPFWMGDKAAGQLEKCARAEQYRQAYPNIFAGVYIREEMPDEEKPEEKEKLPAARPPPARAEISTPAATTPEPQKPPDEPSELMDVDAIRACATSEAMQQLRRERSKLWGLSTKQEWTKRYDALKAEGK